MKDFMKTKCFMFLAAVAAAATLAVAFPLFAQQVQPPLRPLAPREGDILISGEGAQSKAAVLGAALGSHTTNGVTVSLYVLQAAAPGPPRPDLPDHVFSVTLQDVKEKKIIKDATVSGVISRRGKKQRLSFKPARPVQYQAGVRLGSLDTYKINVNFKKGKQEGKASFTYKMLPAPPEHVEKAINVKGSEAAGR